MTSIMTICFRTVHFSIRYRVIFGRHRLADFLVSKMSLILRRHPLNCRRRRRHLRHLRAKSRLCCPRSIWILLAHPRNCFTTTVNDLVKDNTVSSTNPSRLIPEKNVPPFCSSTAGHRFVSQLPVRHCIHELDYRL